MPEELMIRCENCGLVFNKITYPECPRCRHLRRKASDILPGRAGGGDEFFDGGPRGAAVNEILSSVLPFVLVFLAGGASFLIGVNLSAGLPWYESPVAVLRVPEPYVVWRNPPKRDTGELEAPPTATPLPVSPAGEEVLKLADFSKTIDETNRIAFEGTIQNVSNVPVESARVSVSGFDATNTELQSDWTLLAPSKLEPGESGKFRLRIVNHPSIEQLSFKASWTQPVERELRTVSTVAPEPAP